MAVLKRQTNVLTSNTPAGWWCETWREGFFIGNGVIGANVLGGIANEQILINHADLLWQGRINVVPDVSSKLREVRQLVDSREFAQAGDVYPRALVSKNFRPQHYYQLPLCVLKAKSITDKSPREYSRTLNLATAEVNVSYLDGQTRVNRNCFVSRENDTFVYEITKTGTAKQLNVEFSFDVMDIYNARTPNSMSNMPEGVKTNYDKNFMYFSARNDDGSDYGAIAKLAYYGGNSVKTDNGIRITGANSIILYLKTFVKSSSEKEFSRLKTELTALKDPYDKLLKGHTQIHQKLYGSATFGYDNTTDEPIENLLTSLRKGESKPSLIEKMWKYARYVLVCSTNERRMFNPYGLWCGSYKAAKSVLPFSGAVQEIGEFGLTGNMLYCAEALFDYVDEHIGEFKDNAVRLFNCKGVFIPSIVATNTGRLGSVASSAIHFTGCAGITARLYWQYYLLTGNTKFLKGRALPFLKEVVAFYDDFFKTNADGKYDSAPTCLPINVAVASTMSESNFVAKNSYMDFVICKETLQNLINGSNILGVNADELPKWEKMLKRIPEREKSTDGVIQEFIRDSGVKQSFDDSMSTLYGARYMTKADTDYIEEKADLVNTAKYKLQNTCNSQSSYSMALLGSAFAKLGQRQQANECIENVISGCAMNNLACSLADWRGTGVCGNDIWAPMQLQSNIALANAIQHMLIDFNDKGIIIFPCENIEKTSFKAEGLLGFGGTSVDITFNAKAGTLQVDVKAKKQVVFDLFMPDGAKKLNKCTQKLVYDPLLCCVPQISLQAGKTISFVFAYKV